MKRSFLLFVLIIMAGLFIVVGCSSDKDSDKDSEDKGTSEENKGNENTSENESGGELRVALSAQPSTLDQPFSTNTTTKDVSRTMFETLLTTNDAYEPVPMLAESFDISDDGLVYTFKLREGIKFHNDKEMTSEDVVASMNRWLDVSTINGTLFDGAEFEAIDDYTVELQLTKPSALVVDALASAKLAPAIMPKEIVESAGEDGVSEYIGTGPFKFEEWKSDQYIHVTKFDDYQVRDEEASGLGGKREALVDDIYFDFVSDAATRLAGLQTGEYDIGYAFPFDNYEQLNQSGTEAVLEASAELVFIYNKQEGPASDYKLRQAMNAALDIEEILLTAFTNEDIYVMSSSYMNKAIDKWVSNAGEEFYNINDQDKAKELLEEAGYDGEEFVIMTTRDYPHMYSAAVVIQEQLSKIGMNVKLDVYDFPTLQDKQTKLGDWDAYVNGLTMVTTPVQLLAISPTYSGGVNSDEIVKMTQEIEAAETFEEAKAIWDDLQGYAWEEHLPVTNLGGYNTLYGQNDKVSGFTNHQGAVYWNVSVDK